MSGEQSRAAATPCVQPGHRSPRLLPVDEAPSIPEFFQYRVRLQKTVERRDINALVEAADPEIRTGFYAEGPGALRKVFADDPKLWDVNYRALFNLIDGRWRMTAFVTGD